MPTTDCAQAVIGQKTDPLTVLRYRQTGLTIVLSYLQKGSAICRKWTWSCRSQRSLLTERDHRLFDCPRLFAETEQWLVSTNRKKRITVPNATGKQKCVCARIFCIVTLEPLSTLLLLFIVLHYVLAFSFLYTFLLLIKFPFRCTLCVILRLFSALSRRVGALQISVIIIKRKPKRSEDFR